MRTAPCKNASQSTLQETESQTLGAWYFDYTTAPVETQEPTPWGRRSRLAAGTSIKSDVMRNSIKTD